MANGDFTAADRALLQDTHTEVRVIGEWIKGHGEAHRKHDEMHKEIIDKRLNAHADDIKKVREWKQSVRGTISLAGIITGVGILIGAIIYLIDKL